MIETFILIITSFIATNIDDLFIDTLLFASAKTKTESRNIFIGKYIGIGTLLLVSIAGVYGVKFFPHRFISLLGLVPVALGIKEIIESVKSEADCNENNIAEKSLNMLLNTALITIANGADNIGVYIPLFAGFNLWQIMLTTAVFAVMIAVWCSFGKALASLPTLKNNIQKYRKIIVPTVYILLGVYILFANFM